MSKRAVSGVPVWTLVFALIGAATASANLIDVQFTENGAPTMSGAAVVGSSGDVWNTFTSGSSATGLVDTTGTATSVDLSWDQTSGGTFYSGTTSNYDALLDGYMAGYTSFNIQNFTQTAAPIDFTISGLDPGDTYSLYVIAGPGAERPTEVTEGSTTQYISDEAFGGFDDGGNYTEFATLSANSSGDITFSIENDSQYGEDPETDINGIQLEYTPEASPTPEPGSMALLFAGIGLFGVDRWYRRRHA